MLKKLREDRQMVRLNIKDYPDCWDAFINDARADPDRQKVLSVLPSDYFKEYFKIKHSITITINLADPLAIVSMNEKDFMYFSLKWTKNAS